MVRSRAAEIQFFRLALVRFSSSMMPILMLFFGSLSSSSERVNNSTAKATSSEPCIFGLTIYIEPVRELRKVFLPVMSMVDSIGVITPSIIPSKISSPSTKIAGLVIKWPTLRSSSTERPCRVWLLPVRSVKVRSLFSVRVMVLLFFSITSLKSPFIRPNQLR